MLQAIEKAQSIQLTDLDIRHYCYDECNVVSYTQLDRYRNLDEMLGEHGACAFLFETAREAGGTHVGHWCCFTRRTDDTVEFFDSYGLRPDAELGFVSPEFKEHYDENGQLTRLIESSATKERVVYNRTALQGHSKKIDTCGNNKALLIRPYLQDLSQVDMLHCAFVCGGYHWSTLSSSCKADLCQQIRG
jgi:hypothetical protein